MFFINGEEEECARREWGGPVRSVKRNGAEAERNRTGQWERGRTSWNLFYKLVIKIRRNDIIIQQEIEIRMQTSKSLINLLIRSRHHRSTYSSDSRCYGYCYCPQPLLFNVAVSCATGLEGLTMARKWCFTVITARRFWWEALITLAGR